ncbi:hypothetical protein F9L16_07560 [Agarivorans sp. B2Z047]|uniref:hypothetical protein n=1 Tax=Agarivorans sp. B2Z047 TaxID=2652721 RepID=UPI0014071854|nr:hypothetical protein [Agarivorans sp. B2Z047]MPW28863.1 hypothetical protein [Agarivorans sp. B2Z047]UQN41422.1 hypothetical protein LQZ07_16765 [Agarivorans sp. B2Z047]
MSNFQKVHDELFKEHTQQYEYFTRLLLSLSVGFITFTTALNNDGFSLLFKAAICAHAISILLGVWLQFILVYRPINDLNKYIKLSAANPAEQKYMARSPSKTEQLCFNGQVSCFLLAFVLVVVGVLN